MSDLSKFQQPENLTKDRLKSELKKHGISFDNNENKDYYVQLYRSKVIKKTSRRQRSEFSSDEELIRKSPRVGAKKKASKTASQGSYMAGISQLSDEDLAEELRAHGEEPGPVMDSTRGVYQRKLAKLMSEKTKAASQTRHEATDYGTDQLGEWSSHSSEGDTDPEATQQDAEEEEEEGEEETGVMVEEPSMRLRSHTTHTKSDQMAHVSYSTPTRHIESSYLLKKPKEDIPKAGDGDQSTRQKIRKPRSNPPQQRQSPPKATPPQATSVWSSILSLLLLLVMFSVTFLAYDHYTAVDDNTSFVSQAFAFLTKFGVKQQDQ